MRDGVSERVGWGRELARRAGHLLRDWSGRLPGFETKAGVIDLVTQADRESEALLVQGIQARFPDDGILGEEGATRPSKSGFRWVLDPLDGTTNFVHRFPFYMVSVGLLFESERVGAVCYGPAMSEEYYAVAGLGAYLNDQPIRVSGAKALSHALLSTGFPYNRREVIDAILPPIRRGILAAQGLRRCGSAAYDLCMVARGSIDGFFEQGLHPWDTAGGALMVTEAGGTVTHFDGTPFSDFRGYDPDSPELPTLVASNGHIHDALLSEVVSAS